MGTSAAAVISPTLITFLHTDPYEVVGIVLISDVFASAVSAYTYGKNKGPGVPNGSIMMVAVLRLILVGSWASNLVPSATMGSFSVFMTLLPGTKFIVRPVMTAKEFMTGVSKKRRITQSIACGVMVGLACGFVGTGGGMMMPSILTNVLGYELRTAVGTSALIMTFTVLTGALSHFTIDGVPDVMILGTCALSTLLWTRIAARFVNRTSPITLDQVTGVALAVLGAAILTVNYLP